MWIWLTGPSGLHRNSPQGLHISSIRVFNQIRDQEIPITLRQSSECSAQGQVFHCKRRNLGCSSAEGRSSNANSGMKAAVLPGIEQVRQLPVAFRTPLSLQHLNRMALICLTSCVSTFNHFEGRSRISTEIWFCQEGGIEKSVAVDGLNKLGHQENTCEV